MIWEIVFSGMTYSSLVTFWIFVQFSLVKKLPTGFAHLQCSYRVWKGFFLTFDLRWRRWIMAALSAGWRLVCISNGFVGRHRAPRRWRSKSRFTTSPSWKVIKWRTLWVWSQPNSRAPPPCGSTSQVRNFMTKI